ncbi:MAG: translation initiation factor IF-2 [Candidatus Omnitrophota bacterium]
MKKVKESTKKEKKPVKATKPVKAAKVKPKEKPQVRKPRRPKVKAKEEVVGPKRVAVPKEPKKAKVKKPIVVEKPKEEVATVTLETKPPVEEKPAIETPAPTEVVAPPVEKVELKKLSVRLPITVKDLATKLNVKPNDIIMRLMKQKTMATINQALDEETANLIARDFGFQLERPPTPEEEILKSYEVVDKAKLVLRAPVVTLMGHVDHGKTSLLDVIRKSRQTEKEAGGITQHIGAYEVNVGKGHVTFLDTPGHEAFTAMRARGAQATDIVVLVVAADDGVMPQTIEAIDHARAASVPIVVALNKIDKSEADPDKVKKQLMQVGLVSEDWGGKTITVGVSAKTGQGIDELLEMILLEAELLELKADPTRPAKGVVIEGKLSKGSGPIATVLVQAGTLKVGDIVIAGLQFGNIRAMINDLGHRVTEALPSKPVEILGLDGVPQAGDVFFVVQDEKLAKDIVARRQQEAKAKKLQPIKRITLEDLSQQVKEGKVKELKLIVKADVQGSLEALTQSLNGLETKDIKLDIIHSGVGSVNESDVMLVAASNAIIIGFHVELTPEADEKAKLEKVDVRLYRIIYEAISDIRSAVEGLLEPHVEEVFVGRVEVRQVFKVSKAGTIAGSYVLKGKAIRGANCRLMRDKTKVYEGKMSSLKRFKDDVKEVAEGFECGVGLENFSDINVGDIVEIYEIRKTARKL